MNKEHQWLLDEKYNGVGTPAFLADVARIESGEPLAFVLGSIPFINLTIHLDSKPLIPRAETEYWVNEELKTKVSGTFLHSLFNPANRCLTPLFLDLCAGSGCIGLAILQQFPNAKVDFAEIDEAHHATILKNIRENNLPENQTRIFGGDLFENITDAYDVIFTNPPYIDPILDRTEKSVVSYEPHQALYGGEDGMEIITRIITEAPKHLTSFGTLYIEHEPEQCDAIYELGEKMDFTVLHFQDQYNVFRYSTLCKNT